MNVTATSSLIAVLGVGLATYVMRAGLILALADRELPEPVTRALRYVAPAVLSALVVSLIADPEAVNNGISIAEAVGLSVAAIVAWKSKNLVVTLAGGMTVFWILLAVT